MLMISRISYAFPSTLLSRDRAIVCGGGVASTARIERAPSECARSASTEATRPAPRLQLPFTRRSPSRRPSPPSCPPPESQTAAPHTSQSPPSHPPPPAHRPPPSPPPPPPSRPSSESKTAADTH